MDKKQFSNRNSNQKTVRIVMIVCILVIAIATICIFISTRTGRSSVAKTQKTDQLKATESLKETEKDKNLKHGKTTEDTADSKATEAMNTKGNVSNSVKKSNLPQAGVKTIANLLMTGKQPIGKTMYIWGGGWNEADTGAGVEAVHIGLSSTWAEFAAKQNASYDYKNTRYQIHNGLDCSGFIGWTVYNVMNTTDGGTGCVRKATTMAQAFSDNGWGTYTPAGKVKDWKPGDVMSMKGHVWFSLGMCSDGSVVVMHASPPGTRICGTNLSDGSKSQAVKLAESYMRKYYPDWYAKYPDCSETISYLSDSSQMRWNSKTLSDPEEIANMNAKQVLEFLYQ